MTGHVFIVHGDLTSIACDAIFVPTDEAFTFTESWDSLELEKPSQGWNGQSVILYRNTAGEPTLWLGNIGQAGNDNPFAAFEPAIKDFVSQATAHLLHEGADRPWPRPRLALNVVGSGEGGARTTKGGLILGLVRLLRGLARDHQADIIFVTYGDKAYAAAQQARRKLVMGEDVDELSSEDVKREWQFADFVPKEVTAQAISLAEVARSNRLVLFIGAGCSVGAGVPGWKQLLRDAADKVGIDEGYLTELESRDLRDWATLINRKMSAPDSIHKLTAKTIARYHRYSLQHALLASLPSNEAVTTNFDQLFELASRVAERDLSVLPMHPGRSASGWLLKLHGSVEDPSQMVLTRSDYLNMPRNRGALMGLVQGLLLTRHMLYVGYSLSDEDFHELIHEVRAAVGSERRQRATMITLSADQPQRDLWEDDFEIVTIGVAPRLKTDITAESSRQTVEAGRQVEIFLDLVGFWAATSAPFFLDSDYSEMADDEPELKDCLKQLATVTQVKPRSPVAEQTRRLLLDLGWPETQMPVNYTERLTLVDHNTGRIRIRRKRFWGSSRPVTVDLRGTKLNANWDRREYAEHRCGVLTFEEADHSTFRSLVEPGERLAIRRIADGAALLGENC